MKNYLKNLVTVGFLALFLPYTITLLVNGRQGIHRESEWTELEYQVLDRMLQEDLSWMDDDMLSLMAVICRTECAAQASKQKDADYIPLDRGYEKIEQAVQNTRGMAVLINGEYRELPYHAVSAGCTRDGSLLGQEYSYVIPAECPEDLKSESYLQVCTLTQEDLNGALGFDVSVQELQMEYDAQGYVTWVSKGDTRWTGESFRTLLHLPSSCIRMDQEGDDIRITVKGSGHGFGISLYTASRMLREGSSIQEILQKFYENAECITIP